MDWKIWHRRLRIAWVTVGLSFTLWLVWNMQAHGVDAGLLESSATLTVEIGSDNVAFIPRDRSPDRPLLVFLPGGAVSPTAYVPLVRRLADAGWPSVLVELPWRMAFSESSRQQVWERVERAQARWSPNRPIVLGGHSRGAALSARFAYEHPQVLAGLLLIGTTHPRDHNLASLQIPVIKISGSRDCVASVAGSEANRHLLPAIADWSVIDGANHAQFAYYGWQLGDCSATIGREEQQEQTTRIVLDWLQGHVQAQP